MLGNQIELKIIIVSNISFSGTIEITLSPYFLSRSHN